MTDTKLLMFERDADQNNVPSGTIAYILRAWGVVYEGIVSRVSVENGLPALGYDASEIGASARPATYPSETSRLFVKEDAEIDPAVFEIMAPPIPRDIPGHL